MITSPSDRPPGTLGNVDLKLEDGHLAFEKGDLVLTGGGDAVADMPPFTFPEAGDIPLLLDTKPPDNHLCAGAVKLPFVSSKASVKASTSGAVNEYGAGVNCGTASAKLFCVNGMSRSAENTPGDCMPTVTLRS